MTYLSWILQKRSYTTLTAVVNALVTAAIGGIVLYRIQKKIDNSYFEQQTKFKRLHEKRVEALETFYHKFVVFSDNLSEIIENTRNGVQTDGKNFKEIQKQLTEKHEDLLHYFENNRLFLPDTINDEIWKIIINSGLLSPIVAGIFFDRDIRRAVPDWWTEMIIELFHLEVSGLDLRNPDVFLKEIEKIIKKQSRTLENLYKSVAETPTK